MPSMEKSNLDFVDIYLIGTYPRRRCFTAALDAIGYPDLDSLNAISGIKSCVPPRSVTWRLVGGELRQDPLSQGQSRQPKDQLFHDGYWGRERLAGFILGKHIISGQAGLERNEHPRRQFLTAERRPLSFDRRQQS
jgi:hypothetical protein